MSNLSYCLMALFLAAVLVWQLDRKVLEHSVGQPPLSFAYDTSNQELVRAVRGRWLRER
jgi:hypothetical protein